MQSSIPTTIFRTVLVGLWVLLVILLLRRDFFVQSIDSREAMALERDRRIEYQSIYFKDRKIGYVEHHYLPLEDQTMMIRQHARMQLMIAERVHPVELDLEAQLDSRNELTGFDFSFTSPFYKMKAQGTVTGDTVSFELDTGDTIVSDQVVLNGPPRLSTSRRAYLLGEGIAAGEKVKIPWFDPFSLTGKESIIEYRGKEKVLINDRVYNLHRFTENFGGARLNSWLDDTGNVVKEESPAGFVFIKEPEFKATLLPDPDDDQADLLASVAVPVKGDMFDVSTMTQAHYRLTLPEGVEFDLDSGRQQFNDPILTVSKEDIRAGPVRPGSCGDAEAHLLASPYIQAGAPEIIDQSLAVTKGETDPLGKAQALAAWVYNHLDKRPVIGIPDALTTLKAGIGDCNEHASLFAALSRAAQIPTKIAVGVVYHKEAFYYHAWNEVCVDGRWLSLDTTTNQFPADLSHLKFIEGELQEQVRIGALLNTLEIEPLHE
ncbi:MAG: transglutaminase-like domain-containing protein [Desulfofustis sp.]